MYTLSIFVCQPVPSARWNLPKLITEKRSDPTYFSHVLLPWLVYYVIKYFVNQRSQNKPLLIWAAASPSFERIISYSYILVYKRLFCQGTTESKSTFVLVFHKTSSNLQVSGFHKSSACTQHTNHRKREK